MSSLDALALASFVIICAGGLAFTAMVFWSIHLEYRIHAQWQLIGPATEKELRAQGMPDFNGLEEGRFHQLKVVNALQSTTVTTDDALARSIHHYGCARRISLVSGGLIFAAMLVLLYTMAAQRP